MMTAHLHPSLDTQLIGGLFPPPFSNGNVKLINSRGRMILRTAQLLRGTRTHGRGRLIKPSKAKLGSEAAPGRQDERYRRQMNEEGNNDPV